MSTETTCMQERQELCVGDYGSIVEALCQHAADTRRIFAHFVQSGTEHALTYDVLLKEAGRMASQLSAAGVRPGDPVLIMLRHSQEMLQVFLGAMLLGAIPSFLPARTDKQDPDLYWESHRHLFKRFGSGIVIAHEDSRLAIDRILEGLDLMALSIEAFCKSGHFSASVPIDPDQVAFLQHSSGTTGLKKGVALTHRAVLRQVKSYASSLKLNEDDRIVSWLPLYHDMGLIACFILPLITGIPVVLMDPFEWVGNPGLLFDKITTHRSTLCWMPNFAFNHLARVLRARPHWDLTSIRSYINCSEPCKPASFDVFAKSFERIGVRRFQLQVCYAMAEAVFAVTQTNPGEAAQTLLADKQVLTDSGRRAQPAHADAESVSFVSAGRPLEGIRVTILGADQSALSDDEIGEIVLTGDFLFSGYHKLPEETEKKLCSGRYFTGDLGFLHDGHLYVTGRKNDLIIVHGRNYYAHDIEFVANQIPGIHPGRCVALGFFRAEVGSEELVVIAEVETKDSQERVAIVNRIKDTILSVSGLQVFDVLAVDSGWLHKTTSGKISRAENLSKYKAFIMEAENS